MMYSHVKWFRRVSLQNNLAKARVYLELIQYTLIESGRVLNNDESAFAFCHE